MNARSRSLAPVLLVVALLAPVLTSCTSVRNALGTRDGICFSSLPAARQTVGTAASLAGVRYVAPTALVNSLERVVKAPLVAPASFRGMPRRGVCLVGFGGRFAGRFSDIAWRPQRGPYGFAVVVLRQSDHHVIGVILLRRPTLRFAHLS